MARWWLWLVPPALVTVALAKYPISGSEFSGRELSGREPEYDGVLLDFSATWCGPCQQMSPLVSRLERQGLPIRKVNVDREPALARKFGVRSIPAFVLVVNDREVTRVVGATSEATLRSLMARIPKRQAQIATAPAAPKPKTGISLGRSQNAVPVAAKPRSKSRFPIRIPFLSRSQDQKVASTPPKPPVIRAKINRRDLASSSGKAATPTTSDPVAASVRIRIRDPQGVNYGSGTVIESRIGHTIVLTCGHIFRDLGSNASIEVDVFANEKDRRANRSETFVGRVLRYDLEADVGLLTIATDSPLPTCRMAGTTQTVAKNETVFSVGCGGGEPPTKQKLSVTALNRYLGPDNIECTGVPLQGRSGGGLFDADGRVIGVCVFADPRDQRGLYVGTKAVHALLDQARLGRLYKGRGESIRDGDTRDETPRNSSPRPLPFDPSANPVIAKNDPPRPTVSNNVIPASLESPRASSSQGNVALANALASTEDAEVICIIRRHNEPRESSRVVIINRASPKFVSYLTGETRDQPQMTTDYTPVVTARKAARAANVASARPHSRAAQLLAGSGWQTESRTPTSGPTRYRRSLASR